MAQVMVLFGPQVKTHLQAQAASEIAVGHQYKHQVRDPQSCYWPNHPLHFPPDFLLYPIAPTPPTALPVS